MRHVFWIGGPPASGKTAAATRLARRWGLRLYSADTQTWVHRDRALAAGSGAAHRWESMTPSERWERSTPHEMLELSLHRERGPMVIDDLRHLPESPAIVAEGSTLPADAVSSGIAERTQAVWLLPTPKFQAAQLAARGTTCGAAQLYRLLDQVIERDALEHHVQTLEVDGSRSLQEVVCAVERLFGGALSTSSRAETADARRRLLREANKAVVAQVRAGHARPWAVGDPDVVTRQFVCECGDPSCETDVSLTVRAAAAGRALVPGHDVKSP